MKNVLCQSLRPFVLSPLARLLQRASSARYMITTVEGLTHTIIEEQILLYEKCAVKGCSHLPLLDSGKFVQPYIEDICVLLTTLYAML